ncbi:hypothetical protein CKO11_03595 [Rhodobacter sp. TJ_12]|uniref:HupE/UreJ family protein n=1 Tax=Rhodobacter sp. TJ_12 TaxID=2029399 RepID=UPI001CBFEBCC|nr:HupE/UreJ family protein [Rhodobacter sp. TJ_12]MBZ4021541.1 hypothetical protein [Rhodobacter sp. TJ_12]
MSVKTLFAAAVPAAALIVLPSVALAHPGHALGTSFAAGALHPLTGLDHALAMVLVGALSVQQGGAARWALPAAFVAAMAAGIGLGATGLALPLVEAGIAVSLVLFGLAVAFGWRAPLAAASSLVAVFGLLHGHAHGVEAGAGFALVAGMLGATALLHGTGIALGLIARRHGVLALRLLAGGTACFGLGLMGAAI